MKRIILMILVISFLSVGCIFQEDQDIIKEEAVEDIRDETNLDDKQEDIKIPSRSVYLKVNKLQIENGEILNQVENVFDSKKFNFDEGDYYEVIVYTKEINEKITGLSVALNYDKEKIKKVGYELNSPWNKGLTIEWSSDGIYQFNSALRSEERILDGKNIIGRFIFENVLDNNEGVKNIYINERMTKMTTISGKDENGNNNYKTISDINFGGTITIK
ncbi:MAG: hypothetical protein ACQERZ_03140 [Fusobacteriota bacterium]